MTVTEAATEAFSAFGFQRLDAADIDRSGPARPTPCSRPDPGGIVGIPKLRDAVEVSQTVVIEMEPNTDADAIETCLRLFEEAEHEIETRFETELDGLEGVRIRRRTANPKREHYKIVDNRKAYVSCHDRGENVRGRKLIDCTNVQERRRRPHPLALQPYFADFEENAA